MVAIGVEITSREYKVANTMSDDDQKLEYFYFSIASFTIILASGRQYISSNECKRQTMNNRKLIKQL